MTQLPFKNVQYASASLKHLQKNNVFKHTGCAGQHWSCCVLVPPFPCVLFLGIVVWRREAEIQHEHLPFWAPCDAKRATQLKIDHKLKMCFHIASTPIHAPQPHLPQSPSVCNSPACELVLSAQELHAIEKMTVAGMGSKLEDHDHA